MITYDCDGSGKQTVDDSDELYQRVTCPEQSCQRRFTVRTAKADTGRRRTVPRHRKAPS